jgi:hypothetical protein
MVQYPALLWVCLVFVALASTSQLAFTRIAARSICPPQLLVALYLQVWILHTGFIGNTTNCSDFYNPYTLNTRALVQSDVQAVHFPRRTSQEAASLNQVSSPSAQGALGTNIVSTNSLSVGNDMTALWPRYINIRRQMICAFLGKWVLCPWEILARCVRRQPHPRSATGPWNPFIIVASQTV